MTRTTRHPDPCYLCNRRSDNWDHIEPVANGGLTVPDNLARTCRRCNNTKGKEPLLLFLAKRRQLECGLNNFGPLPHWARRYIREHSFSLAR